MITEQELSRLQRDSELRQIYDLRILVVGGGFQYIKMFYDAGFKGAVGVDDANIICFTGGSDVNPSFYGEKILPGTSINAARDEKEANIFGQAIALKKPMIGICRGAQFLNVMNGGRLWQDVNNHATAKGHAVLDLRTNTIKDNMTSTHHQQMIPAAGADVLALADLSTKKVCEKEVIERDTPDLDDVEVVWYNDSLCLCFQPHPEFNHGECRNYFLDLVDEYVMPAC